MKQLKLGVGRRSITPEIGGMLAGYAPPRPSTCVNDEVHVIVFAFETEGKQALLFSCELTNFLVEMIPYMKDKLTQATGVPAILHPIQAMTMTSRTAMCIRCFFPMLLRLPRKP